MAATQSDRLAISFAHDAVQQSLATTSTGQYYLSSTSQLLASWIPVALLYANETGNTIVNVT